MKLFNLLLIPRESSSPHPVIVAATKDTDASTRLTTIRILLLVFLLMFWISPLVTRAEFFLVGWRDLTIDDISVSKKVVWLC